MAFILVSNVCFVISLNGRYRPISSMEIFFALYFWSPNKGIPNTGTPWYTASWRLCSPHCVINILMLWWAGNGEKQNTIRHNYKISTEHLPPSTKGKNLHTHVCWGLIRTQSHSAAGRIKPMKRPSETCDLPACSAVRQPTAPQRVNNFICRK